MKISALLFLSLISIPQSFAQRLGQDVDCTKPSMAQEITPAMMACDRATRDLTQIAIEYGIEQKGEILEGHGEMLSALEARIESARDAVKKACQN